MAWRTNAQGQLEWYDYVPGMDTSGDYLPQDLSGSTGNVQNWTTLYQDPTTGQYRDTAASPFVSAPTGSDPQSTAFLNRQSGLPYNNTYQLPTGSPSTFSPTGPADSSFDDLFGDLFDENSNPVSTTTPTGMSADEKYFNELNYALQTRAQTLAEQESQLTNALNWASDANKKAEIQVTLDRLHAEIANNQAQMQETQRQYDLSLQQRQYEYGNVSATDQATLSLQQKQMELDNAYKQGLLTNDQYANETNRIQTEYQNNYWQGQLGNERTQQQIDQNNYLAQMAAKPINWIQYNQAAGQPTVAQPWMSALGGAQTGTVIGGQQYQTGVSNPGGQSGEVLGNYTQVGASTPGTSVAGTPNTMGLPELTMPSMQTYNLMPNSSQQQWQGYEQARTGRTPEDLQQMLWMRSAPTGQQTLQYR
jgi:hypothetical protein